MATKIKLTTVEYEFNAYLERFPSCCGIAIVHCCYFKIKIPKPTNEQYEEIKARMYKGVYNLLVKNKITNSNYYDLDRCKVLMADQIRDRPVHFHHEGCAKPSIYDFCMSTGWEYGNPTKNKKSGNMDIVFEINRETHSGN